MNHRAEYQGQSSFPLRTDAYSGPTCMPGPLRWLITEPHRGGDS